ncbi:hypothetical protein [Gracilibacillus salinarum]|uniref:Uncharacterized protein n=1 Tax=Gracilibacillus salinarum TaxID=2932255 RepID=A0ABY4GQQ9_9BACI|nr:hypothetical protein [Gracilibacillus salinarum]UOQ86741.1 hypothetical protein MUN87_07595 [Gracilibacillus salinarum]
MTVQYTNFRGDEYFLHMKKTSEGNLNYYFKKDDPNTSVDSIPEGYEIYEHPNGRVFLTKEKERTITDQEVKIIEASINNYSPIKDCKLDPKGDSVFVYTYENPVPFNENPLIVEALSDPKYKTYVEQLCFTIINKETREFMVERKSYTGDKGQHWLYLEASTDLEHLTEKYMQHLGQDSYFDLDSM